MDEDTSKGTFSKMVYLLVIHKNQKCFDVLNVETEEWDKRALHMTFKDSDGKSKAFCL